jgi:hypothetical protein
VLKYTPEQIRNFLASKEFEEFATADMPTADSAWHYWLQPKYDQEIRRKFIESHRNPYVIELDWWKK